MSIISFKIAGELNYSFPKLQRVDLFHLNENPKILKLEISSKSPDFEDFNISIDNDIEGISIWIDQKYNSETEEQWGSLGIFIKLDNKYDFILDEYSQNKLCYYLIDKKLTSFDYNPKKCNLIDSFFVRSDDDLK